MSEVMSLGPLSPRGGVDPSGNSYAGNFIFVFQRDAKKHALLDAPEGVLRYTLWRPFTTAEATALGIDTSKGYAFVTVQCDPRLIIQRGSVTQKLERYFGESTIDDFGFDIYDPGSSAWVDLNAVLTYEGNSYKGAVQLSIDERVEERLLLKYIKPTEDAEVYGQIEFQGFNEDKYSLMASGQMKNAITGKDLRWKHPIESPFLTADNTPIDAERTWSLKFVATPLCGFGLLPAAPGIRVFDGGSDTIGTPQDKTRYCVPWYTGPHDPNCQDWQVYDFFNFAPVIQHANDMWQWENEGRRTCGRWARHVNIRKLLGYFCEAAFGTLNPFNVNGLPKSNWNIIADDSPFQYQWGSINSDRFAGNGHSSVNSGESQGPIIVGDDPINPDAGWITVNPSFTNRDGFEIPPQQWMLLPLAATGLYEGLTPDSRNPHPKVENAWPLRFKTAEEIFQELCIFLGYDRRMRNDGKTITIELLSKLNHNQPFFSTIVPHEATPVAFPESENGISFKLGKTFESGDAATATFPDFNDWFALRPGTVAATPAHTGPDDPRWLSTRPQSDPYIIPQTAQKPNENQMTLCFGGPASGLDKQEQFGNDFSDDGQVAWYSLDQTANLGSATGTTIDQDAIFPGNIPMRSFNWPTLAPLVMMNGVDATKHHDGSGNPWPGAFYPTPPPDGHGLIMTGLFAPVIRGRFSYTFADGTVESFECDSARQMLARFYSLFYVRSGIKYTCKYQTVQQFFIPSDPTVPMSWQNVQLRYLVQLFEPKDQVYYVKARTIDLDAWDTTLELLQTESVGPRDWNDDQEETGQDASGNKPSAPPRIGITNLTGAAISPNPGAVLLHSTPVNVPDATVSQLGATITVKNVSGSDVALQYTTGQGTNISIPDQAVYSIINNGSGWTLLGNTIPGAEGTVTNVSGATNRVAVSNGTTTPTIDISTSYVGQTSITTLGTITTGTWNGTAIANANLANSSVTVTAGTGLTGGGSISLGGTSTISIDYVTAPVHFNSTGTTGQWARDPAGNVYHCYAPNLWVKLSGSTSF